VSSECVLWWGYFICRQKWVSSCLGHLASDTNQAGTKILASSLPVARQP
jgi:hypothetical protein